MPEARPNLFTDRDEDCHVVSVEDFIRNVRGSTGFTFDKLLLQLSVAEDEGQDFCINHGDMRFKVPLAHIREFFKTHEKPMRPMTPEQEVLHLRKKLQEAEAEIASLKGIDKVKPKGTTVADVLKGQATPVDLRDEFDQADIRNQMVAPAAKPAAPPEPEITIPPRDQRIPDPLPAIQQELKDNLQGKKPYNPREAAAKGVPIAEHSPSAPASTEGKEPL